MRSIGHHIFLAGIILLSLSSCYSSKKIYYLNGAQDSVYSNLARIPLKVEVGDQLSIIVSGLNLEATAIINAPNFMTTPSNMQPWQAQNNPIIGYLVDDAGNIVLNKIGSVHAAGLTYTALKDTLEKRFSFYLKEPVVSIRLVNFRVTVLGEVAKPGTYSIVNSDLNIFQALGLAGDLLITGKRKNILLYRQTDFSKITYRIDLTDKLLIRHPAFNLKSGDVLYVEPNKVKLNTGSSFLQLWPTIVSAGTLLILVITNIN